MSDGLIDPKSLNGGSGGIIDPRAAKPINAGSTPAPKPMGSYRAVDKVSQAIREKLDKELTEENLIDQLHKEYDHILKTGNRMCGESGPNRCMERHGVPICDFHGYLRCSYETLEWRLKEDMPKTLHGPIPGLVTEEHMREMEYVLARSMDFIKQYLRRHGVHIGSK